MALAEVSLIGHLGQPGDKKKAATITTASLVNLIPLTCAKVYLGVLMQEFAEFKKLITQGR